MNKYKIEISTFNPFDGPIIELIINDEYSICLEPTSYYLEYIEHEDVDEIKEWLFNNKMKEKDLLDIVNNYYRNWKIKYDALHSIVAVNEKGEIICE